MLNFFKSFLGLGSYIGVDIGTTTIKIAEITKASGKPQLSNYGVLESYGHLTRLNNAIQTSSLKIAARETAEMLKTLFDRGNFKTRDAIVSVPAFSSFVTFLELPEMTAAETEKALKYQLPQYIPMALEEMNVDWMKVGVREDERGFNQQQILVISIPNERIARYQEIFKLAGLKLRILEVESLGLIRALAGDVQSPTLIIDVGSRTTNILVADKGALRYSAQTDFAGASLTQAIANGLGVDIKRAEEIKKQKGILTGAAEYELSTLTLPFLDVIINEAKRAMSVYEKNQDGAVEKVILAGGGANLLGFEDYAKQQFGMPVMLANPFSSVSYPAEVELIVRELGPVLAVAIGLGIREFV